MASMTRNEAISELKYRLNKIEDKVEKQLHGYTFDQVQDVLLYTHCLEALKEIVGNKGDEGICINKE